jgi:hypothetical protein
MFLGSLSLGLFSNLFARVTRGPGSILMTQGIRPDFRSGSPRCFRSTHLHDPDPRRDRTGQLSHDCQGCESGSSVVRAARLRGAENRRPSEHSRTIHGYANRSRWVATFKRRSFFGAICETDPESTLAGRGYLESMMHDRYTLQSPWAPVMAITFEGTYEAGPTPGVPKSPADYRLPGGNGRGDRRYREGKLGRRHVWDQQRSGERPLAVGEVPSSD